MTSSPELLIKKKQSIALDATLTTALMECGTKLDLRFNHRFVPIAGKSNSLEVGSIVHKFLEVYYESIYNGIKRNDACGFGLAAAELYVRGCPYCFDFIPTAELTQPKCGHQINEYPGVENTPIDNDKDRIGWKYALDSCELYHERWKNDSWKPVKTEHVLGKVIYEDDNIQVLWKAKIDSLMETYGPRGIVSMDHKTMKQRRTSLSMNNQFIGQCILTNSQTMFINRFGWQTTLKPEQKFERVAMNYTMARINEWKNEIIPYWAYKLLEYHDDDYYPPNWTSCHSQYGWCQFHSICDADPGIREELLRQKFMVGKEWDIQNV
jgi:hypothetical protein